MASSVHLDETACYELVSSGSALFAKVSVLVCRNVLEELIHFQGSYSVKTVLYPNKKGAKCFLFERA